MRIDAWLPFTGRRLRITYVIAMTIHKAYRLFSQQIAVSFRYPFGSITISSCFAPLSMIRGQLDQRCYVMSKFSRSDKDTVWHAIIAAGEHLQQ